jgi:hypothetical protein
LLECRSRGIYTDVSCENFKIDLGEVIVKMREEWNWLRIMHNGGFGVSNNEPIVSVTTALATGIIF